MFWNVQWFWNATAGGIYYVSSSFSHAPTYTTRVLLLPDSGRKTIHRH